MSKNKIIASWCLIVLVWALINILTLHYPGEIFDKISSSPIEIALTLPSEATTPAGLPQDQSSTHWEETQLPDDWLARQAPQNQIWYKFRFEPNIHQNTPEAWAVYISHVTHNTAVYLNGLWLGQSGQFEDPVSRHHNQPQLFKFSRKLLKPGENELLIRVKAAYKGYGLLSPIYVEPLAVIQPAYKFKTFVRVTVVQWLTIVMALMAVTVSVFYIARPQDAIYGIFSAELFVWSAHNLNLFVHNIPVSTRLWEAMTMATLGWAVVLMVFFNHRFVGVPVRIIERSIVIFACLGFGLYFLPTIEQFFYVGYKVWDVFLVIFGSYALGYLLRRYWLEPDIDKLLMILSGIPILVFGLHDILLVNGFRPRTEGLIIQYSALPALLVFSWFIVKRFVKSINQAEDLSRNLEQKVRLRERELEEQFQQVRNLEQHKLLSDERERIMRDMHDGIGSQLVSLVTSLHKEDEKKLVNVRNKIKQSLEDLRLVIDSLDPGLNNIGILLGTLRERLEDPLQAAGIKLIWDVGILPEHATTTPRQNLHVLRITQEAIANAIKHAQCSQIILKTRFVSKEPNTDKFTGEHISLDVIDNGKGFNSKGTAENGHYGINNMQHRAEEMGGHLSISSDAGGTRLHLTIPV